MQTVHVKLFAGPYLSMQAIQCGIIKCKILRHWESGL